MRQRRGRKRVLARSRAAGLARARLAVPMKSIAQADPARVILLAPAIFLLHVLEEAPRFVDWFNSLVRQGITQGNFLRVNAFCFLVTLALATVASIFRN